MKIFSFIILASLLSFTSCAHKSCGSKESCSKDKKACCKGDSCDKKATP